MCRFYGFRATEPTSVAYTLVESPCALLAQSRIDRRGESHPDGWGLGFYVDGGPPEIVRSASPAFEDHQFLAMAERVCARTVLAHVRQATVGGASLANTHPFVYGRWIFAHNGTVFPYAEVEPLLAAETDPRFAALRGGTTDSEAVFVWLLSRMARAGFDPDDPPTEPAGLVDLLADAMRQLGQWCSTAPPETPARLNLMLTDGDLLLATRWNHTLSWLIRESIHDAEAGRSGASASAGGGAGAYRAVIVASEPLTDEAWQEVPDRSIVWIDRDVHARLRAL